MDTRKVSLEPTETDAIAVRYGKCIIGAVAPLPFQNFYGAYFDGRLIGVEKTDWAAAYRLASWCGY